MARVRVSLSFPVAGLTAGPEEARVDILEFYCGEVSESNFVFVSFLSLCFRSPFQGSWFYCAVIRCKGTLLTFVGFLEFQCQSIFYLPEVIVLSEALLS